MKKLPIGIQSIKKILGKNEYLYVDKTGFIKKLIDEGSPHYFLSRPRRFGKSLFLNTLEEVFKGNKELFKGFEIYQSDYDWQEYPVLYFDFSQIASSGELQLNLKEAVIKKAKFNGVVTEGSSMQIHLTTLIEELAKKNQVVVLVDEYDSSIINNLERPEIAERNRDVLRDFFGTLKSLDRHLKFTFVTGVSKFSQVSLFSGPNNLTDITMDSRYATMMGYTEEELKVKFQNYIESIAKNRSERDSFIKKEYILEEIRAWYNGYRFSEKDLPVYNPYSTLRYLRAEKAETYWYSTGTPSFLIDQVKHHPKSMIPLDGSTATKEELMDISSLEEIDVKALMYQTGYFTIQGYNSISKRYHLGLPNEEVRTSFINSLVKNFTSIVNVRSSEKFLKALEKHDIEPLFEHIELGFASFAYQVFSGAKECTYQGMLLSMMYGMGFDPLSERSTSTGRIDVVLDLPKATYILELKLDDSADKALSQIQNKEYFKPYTQKEKEIVIIGASFSSATRNISDWKGELLSEYGKFIKKFHRRSIRK